MPDEPCMKMALIVRFEADGNIDIYDAWMCARIAAAPDEFADVFAKAQDAADGDMVRIVEVETPLSVISEITSSDEYTTTLSVTFKSQITGGA